MARGTGVTYGGKEGTPEESLYSSSQFFLRPALPRFCTDPILSEPLEKTTENLVKTPARLISGLLNALPLYFASDQYEPF